MLSTIPAEQITHRFLITGVALAALLPRLPYDPPGFHIGGDVSHGFRKLLLFLVGINIVRMLLLTPDNEWNGFGDFLGTIEVTGLTFLCFLTTYALQHGLSCYFNINPGSDLKLPLMVVAGLSLSGVVFSKTIHPNLWCLKKLANVASSPPIIRTLKSHNTFVSAQSHGRGFIIGQTLLTIEYWHIAVQLCCTFSYAFNRHLPAEDQTGLDVWMQAARSAAFLADWTRVLAHAIFLNQMDELHQLSHRTDGSAPPSPEALVRA